MNKDEKLDIALGFMQQSPVDIQSLARRFGFDVIEDDLNNAFVEPASGAIYVKDGEKIIFVHEKDNDQRKRFTIAHELSHYILHFGNDEVQKTSFISFRRGTNKIEKEADELAGKILMPMQLIVDYYKDNGTPILKEMAKYFDVSTSAMRVRLETNGLKYYV